MRLPSSDFRTIAVAAAAAGAGGLLALAGALHPYVPFEFSGLIVVAVLISSLTPLHPIADGRGAMRPSFVIEFAALLIFGPGPATIAAGAAAIVSGRLQEGRRAPALERTLLDATIAVAAIQAAGLARGALAGALGQPAWPMRGVPIAAAVVAFGVVRTSLTQLLPPLIARRSIGRAWPGRVLAECPRYFIGAGLAIGLVELLADHTWQLLPIVAVPALLAWRAYGDYLALIEEADSRHEVAAEIDHAMCVVDRDGRVVLWDDTLDRLLGCGAEQVQGRPLASAVAALHHTGVPRALGEVLKTRTPQALPHVGVTSHGATRILEVRMLPVDEGATLLWQDVTRRTQAEQALKRSGSRLELAAEGASDGLWEWDLRTQEFYRSGRWNALLGAPAPAGIDRPEVWLERVHPDDVAALKGALDAHLAGETEWFEHEHRIRHGDGTYRWVLCRGIATGAGRHPSRIAGSMTDTTDRVAVQERLRTAGFLDPLTGLRNRSDFVECLGRRLDELKRRPGGDQFAVLYLDLDRFKVINDSLGHLIGDELLIAVARRLESCLRQGDCVGRLGGDEFAILLNSVADELRANAVAFRIQDSLGVPLSVGGREVFTSASIGIAVGHARYGTPDEIMRDADTAMYHAKSRGKARHELFDADMHARVRDRLGLESDLRHAVASNGFEVHYQPIVLLGTRMCVGFESLIRWTRNGEKVSPATFIPMAEELGLIDSVGTWVLQQACQTFADWQRRYPNAGLDYITVNASGRQLTQQNFINEVEQATEKSGLKPSSLRIEVTETALMDSPNQAANLLGQLRQLGVKVYLDDFGTGYSSLSHLHKLPVDALKIDRSFVTSLLLPERPAIVESILALARTMKTSVVAEGIESNVQARELERLGCTHAQGYLFSRPLSTAAAEALIAANEPLGPKPTAVDEAETFYSPKGFEWPGATPAPA